MKKILVIDDTPAISRLIVQLLKNAYEVEVKEDGFEALAWLQDGNFPDLILTDLEMPNMNGIELIASAKRSGYISNIPIIVLSSKDSSSVRITCLKLGAEDYIMKPFNPEELMIRIERILYSCEMFSTSAVAPVSQLRMIS